MRAYKIKNKEKLEVYNKIWRKNNKDKIAKYNDQYWENKAK